MLSTENPPPDPPCPCEISPLKSSDERASDNVALEEVDLLNSGLDDNNPLPKFSIRDYVFGARSKDINTNWPFSQKNLQLCLKHGVKDLLPPFQPLDSVRHQSVKRCAVESPLLDKEYIGSSDGGPSRPSDHFDTVNKKLATDCVTINSIGSEGDKEFPSTIISQSQSEIDSVPTNRTPCLALETDYLLESPAGKTEVVASPASQKNESTAQPPAKKCRLIVKLSSNTDPCSNEDITSNHMAFSEAMTSKVCPVCKTFSSSSNTTLNAHIDQCLSAESTIKWTANAKVIKHRIKPRKTRLMVDIYTTAPQCTLEDLDRRNGTNWATNSSMLPTQESGMCSEEKKQGALSVNVEATGDEGAVYIDANGRKLRILSKFNESSASEAVVNHGSCKFLKGGKGSKFLSTNRKKHQVQKHQKYLKLATQSKKICSLKPHRGSEIRGGQGRNFAVEENHRKEEHLMQPFKAQEQTKPSDFGTIRKWVCSKRTGLSKKANCKEGLQRLGYNLRQDLLAESDRSSLGDSYVERSCVLKTPNSSGSPPSSPESVKRMNNSSYEARGSECDQQPPQKKRVGFSSFRSVISGNMERSLETPNCNAKQLRKDSTSAHDSCKRPPNYRENNVSCHSNKPVEINAGPVKNTDGSHSVCSKLSQSHHVFSSKATRFPTLRKNVLSVKQSSVPKTNFHLNRKCLSLKKSRVHGIAELDEVEAAWPSEGVEQHDSMQNLAEDQSRLEDITDKMSLGRSSVLKIRKKRAISISQREEAIALKGLHLTPQGYGHDVGENLDSSTRVGGGLADVVDDLEIDGEGVVQTHRGDLVMEPSSRIAVGENDMDLSKSSDPELHKLASPPYTRTKSLRYVEVYKGSFCGAEVPICLTEPSLGDGQEMFCADEVGNGMIGQRTHTGAELDSKVVQGNYFPQVEPIPIPGPPGSFLPSPRDMSSEDLQGNSSLTTSRVQSSEDRHDPVDGDSSDSPISATSTISNFAMVRSDSKSSEKLFVAPPVVLDEIRSGFSSARHDTVMENTGKVSDAASTGIERINLDELKVNVIIPEKGPLSFKNDQPCCCSRKEGTSHVAFNYQDSQLLRRRTMASVPLPDMEKQMNCDPSRRPNNLNSRPEMFTLSNFPSSGSEKKSPAGSIPSNVSADTVLEFPIRGDCDSVSPSASNPILRLMGKNLMVVNKDEDILLPLCEAQSGALNDHSNPPFQTLSGVSPGMVQNGDFNSFHRMVHQGPNHQGPLLFGQNQLQTMGQGFDVRLPNSFRSHVNSKTPQTPFHTPVAMFPSKNMGGASMASVEFHEYKGGYSLPSEQNRPKNRPGTVTHNTEKVAVTLDPQRKNAKSTNSVKEIIIIDDTPESEANSATNATYTDGMRGSQVTSAGISIPMAADYSSRHANPFHSYQPHDSSPYGVSPMVHNAGFQMPPCRRVNASPAKWNCTSEGSSVLHPSSLTASSSSTGHLRPALYYSPSFS